MGARRKPSLTEGLPRPAFHTGRNDFMAYVSEWERLSEALTRVIAAGGLTEDEARTDICRAIADRAVNIRGKLGRQTTGPLRASDTVLEGKYFQIPDKIQAEELDWERSRPVKPWKVPRENFKIPGPWELEWIELFRTDVTNVLCPGGRQSEAAEHASSQPGAVSTSRPTLESRGASVGADLRSIAGLRPAAAGPARRRGRRPEKFEQTRDAMRSDIQQGRCTVPALKDMLEKNLCENYGVSRDVARRARKTVLSEFGDN